MTIQEILEMAGAEGQKVAALTEKTVDVPQWGKLAKEYDPTKHPVMDKGLYPDIVTDSGVTRVTRVTCDLQRLAVKRMTELVTGIPVKRVYSPQNDRQKEVAAWLERIFQRSRIDSVNIERCNMLFAGCEVMTLWYAVEQPQSVYGFPSPLKFRCRDFSPMNGDELYPFFDEYGDMTAMSVAYTRRKEREWVKYFDCYTADRHLKWSNGGGEWRLEADEPITLGKIPCVYMYRPTPVWEDTSKTVYEMEWALSRNGNYLRDNSKPLFVVFADEAIRYGDEGDPNQETRAVMQYPKGSSAQYVTWQQAVDNLKFYVSELRNLFFTQLQLPDWSYEKMSQQALSGESRKQLFIDSQLKVKDESGRLLEFFDREVNVVKSFLKVALDGSYSADVDALPVETVITPFAITDEKDTIDKLMAANGGEPIVSQREAVERLGWSDDVDKTLEEIRQQGMRDAFEPTE